jgi:formate hydrogenlyase subunit 6/NADH:ubiquinone oxidoreductase subunit I
MNEQEVYDRLAEWYGMRGLPQTEHVDPMLKAIFTPEEASLVTEIPFSGRYLEELAELKQMDPAELRSKLDALAKKGAVFRTVTEDTVRYSLNEGLFTMYRGTFWPGRHDERSKAVAPPANQYYYHGWGDQTKDTHQKGLRVLPIETTIEDTRQILPFEEVVKVLESHEYFAVAHCPCRSRKNEDPEFSDCKYSTQVCLHFDRLAHYIVENDLGREVTMEESREILRQAAEEGLVHGISNMVEDVDTICNCCKCCCMFLEAYHKLGHAQGMTPSNYRARVNPELCIGCGLCVKRCPMEAIQLEDSPEAENRVTRITDETGKVKELKNKSGKVATIDTEICIGCGVCAYKCSTESLVLERYEVVTHPPKDRHEFATLMMADIEAARAKK